MKTMKKLADETGLEFDGFDTRLFYPELIHVAVNIMTKRQYNKMEKELEKFSVAGEGYEIYAWNDVSGYEYWKERGGLKDWNYIQVTANVTDPSKVNANKLKADIEGAFIDLQKWNNLDEWANLNPRSC